jgi:transposase InsO family protein
MTSRTQRPGLHSPQTNCICERFHKTSPNEFYRVAFRRKIYRIIEQLQTHLDEWLACYNNARASGPDVLRAGANAKFTGRKGGVAR